MKYEEQRKHELEWLASLKAGDEVVLHPGRSWYGGARIAVVERRTPTGLIVVKGTKYSPTNGVERGDRYVKSSIVEPTPELRHSIAVDVLSSHLKETKWAEIPLDALKKVYAIVIDATGKATP